MAETAGKTNALETEWSRPNMSLFFDDTLDIVTESDSSDSDDGELTDDAIVRMDTSHDYFQLGGNFPASKDKEEKDTIWIIISSTTFPSSWCIITILLLVTKLFTFCHD